MNENAVRLLEFDKIKERLREFAISEQAKGLMEKLQPSTDIQLIQRWMDETTEAREIIDRKSSVPLHGLTDIDKGLKKLGKGGTLNPLELTAISELLRSVAKIKRFMVDMREFAPMVSSYALSMYEIKDLAEEIQHCIQGGRVDDKASSELSRLRKKIGIVEDRIKQKLDSILRSSAYAECIQDAVVSMRNDRYVIPVKKEYRRNLEGNILDTSSTGSTVFVEPEAVKKLQDELNLLKIQEENEVYRILSYLTGIVESYQREIHINVEAIIHYDFIFAKGKYSKSLDCNAVQLNDRGYIRIEGGRHPLIGKAAVPLEFTIGENYRALVITGPNTGGKTVALKTVGLMTMMVQSGLHVPVNPGCEFTLFQNILVDIGDGQSIEQSLSTFSSHIRNISHIIEYANKNTLVIIDEMGAGTEPGEGMGIAIAVLEELYKRGATILATTHYSEIKVFAAESPGFQNGCMEFDVHSLKPLYRLKIGKAGESNAFLIALRLGVNRELIERAHEITYREKKDYTHAHEELSALKTVKKETEAPFIPTERIQNSTIGGKKQTKGQHTQPSFRVGDCVFVSSMNRTGIVCEIENSKGEVGVMIMKKKFKINKKRLSIYIHGSELYPENYNIDIVLESKENRKKMKKIERGDIAGVIIEHGGSNSLL